MLELAEHIIKTKMGKFDPKAFQDRYENAVAEMVRAKIEGRPLKAKPAPKPSNVVDLMAALRESAKAADGASKPKPGKARSGDKAAAEHPVDKKPAPQRRKAGKAA